MFPVDLQVNSNTRPTLQALSDPRVSIVICNFNYGRYLQQAIDSALAQQPVCQVIVVDDGSIDESRALLARADPRVEVVLQPNAGQLAAYNSGFERCTGDVVIFLDADDALEPHAVSTIHRLFDEGIVKVHFRMLLVDEAGRALGQTVPANLATGNVLTPLIRHGVLYPSAPGSGNAYRRSVLQRLFPLPVDAVDRVGADFFLIYGVVAFGSVAACESALVRYRLHRPPQAADDALVFGNAAQGNDEAAKVATRYQRLVQWVQLRTAHAVNYSQPFLDFSVQKSPYVLAVFAQPYRSAWWGSRRVLKRLLQAVWLQPAYGLKKKIGLSTWAVLLLLAPRREAMRLARYVCNPASRTP